MQQSSTLIQQQQPLTSSECLAETPKQMAGHIAVSDVAGSAFYATAGENVYLLHKCGIIALILSTFSLQAVV